MKKSNDLQTRQEDLHSYSALHLNIDSRDKSLFDEISNLKPDIKSNRVEIFNKNSKKEIEEDSERYLSKKHQNTDEIKRTSFEELDMDEDNFYLNSDNSKINPRVERNKPYSQFYEEHNKKTRYIPVDNDTNIVNDDFQVLEFNTNANKNTFNTVNPNNAVIIIPRIDDKNPVVIEEKSKIMFQDVCNDGEIKIGDKQLIPNLETNRENAINENTQQIEDDLESSLMVSAIGCKNLKIDENFKPVPLTIIDMEANSSTEKIKRELSNSAIKCCRVCYEEESDEKGGLIYPCQCTGSCQYIHEICLKKWIENNFMDHKIKAECEICKHEYNMKFYVKWVFSKQKMCNTLKTLLSVVMVSSIILALVFTVIYVVVTALSTMLPREKTNFINILAGAGGGITIFLIILSLRKCKKNFYEQRMCDWKIFNIDGCKN